MPPNTAKTMPREDGDLSEALHHLHMNKVNLLEEDASQSSSSTNTNNNNGTTVPRTGSTNSILLSGNMDRSSSSSSFRNSIRKSVSFAAMPEQEKKSVGGEGDQQQQENSEDYWKRNDSCVELYQEMYWDADGNQTKAAKQELYNAAINNNHKKDDDAKQSAAASGCPSSTASISRSSSNVSLPPDSDSYWKRNDSTPSLYREIYWDQDEEEVKEKQAATEATQQQQHQQQIPACVPQQEDSNVAATMKRNESEFTLSGYDIEQEEESYSNAPPFVVRTGSDSNNAIHLPSPKALGENNEDDAATAVSSSTDYWKRNDSTVSMYKQIYWDEEEK
mmetsp:Transcript_13763/g.33031  ORF Transcript_13763/g.33031 Transcript_13763/m.33031 type:complete len:334 (+) Transcript_13763:155-1156(+)